MTDCFKTWLSCIKLFYHNLGKINKVCFGGTIIIVAVSFWVSSVLGIKIESEPFYTKYNIGHRIVWHRFFRMFNMWIYDYQIVCTYRNRIIFNVKYTFSTDNIEKFRKLMGVRVALPIPFVFRNRNITKFKIRIGYSFVLKIN